MTPERLNDLAEKLTWVLLPVKGVAVTMRDGKILIDVPENLHADDVADVVGSFMKQEGISGAPIDIREFGFHGGVG